MTNLFGVMLMCKEFAPMLISAKGKIVNIGSAAGVVPFVHSFVMFTWILTLLKLISDNHSDPFSELALLATKYPCSDSFHFQQFKQGCPT